MAGYTRQSTFTDGDIINAADSNDEFNQLINAFSNTTGHAHDGTAAEGPVIGLIGDPGVATPINKVVVDDTNNQIEFNIDVSGTSTEQFVVKDGVIEPTTDNDIDLGSTSKEFKNLYLDGTATIDGLAMPTTTVTDILDEDTMSSDSATALATQQSIKAYVDAQLTAQDLDFQGDSGGALAVDLDSETFTIAGGTGIDTTGAGQTLTIDIDSTVATLAGTQTFTNKTIDANGTGNSITNLEVADFTAASIVTETEGLASSDNDTSLPTTAAVKDYVDTQLTAEDLDVAGDTGTGAIDLDSQSLTIAGTANEIETAASGQTITIGLPNNVTIGNNLTVTGDLTISGDDITMGTNTSGHIMVADGTNFNPVAVSGDVTISSAGAVTIENNAVETAMVNANVITGQTAETTIDQSNDTLLMHDNSASALRKITISSLSTALGGLSDVVGDTTPQLGGDLDVNGNDIVSTSNGDIDILPNGTGVVNLDGDGSTGGVSISDGLVDIRTGTGTRSQVKFYCESSNAHAQTIQPQPHSAAVTNTLTLPAGGNQEIVGTTATQTLTNKTLTSAVLNTGVSGTAVLDEDNMASDSATQLATQQSIKAYVDSNAGLSDIVNDTSPQLGGALDTNSFDVDFDDTAKARFGTGNDLQIFHDGSNSYIRDLGTGDLRIHGSTITVSDASDNKMAHFVDGGTAELYYNASKKLETVTGGVTITGTATATAFVGDGSGLTNLPATGDGGIAMAIALG